MVMHFCRDIAVAIAIILSVTPQLVLGQWRETAGPFGGDVRALAMNSAGTIYAGTYGGGVWVSENSGTTWRRAGEQLPTHDVIIDLAVAPDGIIYAAEHRALLKSEDDGQTWTIAAFTGTSNPTTAVAVGSNGRVYAGVERLGVYYSDDDGDSWAAMSSGIEPYTGYSIINDFAESNGYVFAATRGGLLRSPNHGVDWYETVLRVQGGILNSGVRALSVTNKGEIYVGTNINGIYRSTDGGTSWTYLGLDDQFILDIAVSSHGDIYAAINEDPDQPALYRSPNNGGDWIRSGLDRPYIHDFLVMLDNDLLAATEEGIYFSSSGNYWSASNLGLAAMSIGDILYYDDGSLLVSALDIFDESVNNVIFYSPDNGDSWQVRSSGIVDANIVSMAVDHNSDILALSQYNIYSSSSLGLRWNLISSIPDDSATILCVDTVYRKYYIGTTRGLYIYDPEYNSWTDVYIDNVYIRDIDISDEYVLAGTRYGMYISSDRGVSWELMSSDEWDVSSVVVHPNGYWFAYVVDKGMFRTTDGGVSWHYVGMSNITINELGVDGRGFIVAATSFNGVYETRDYGDSWHRLGDGYLEGARVAALATTDQTLFAGTWGRGVWRTSISQSTSSSSDISTYTKPVLLSNYPNPTRTQTRIKFRLPRSDYVTITLFDAAGREMETLVSRMYGAGDHAITWDGKNLAPGLYLYRLTVGDYQDGRTLILLP